ncbi:ABA4-like family protein [Synechococcus sp. R60.3]|uniref:ABA4-like family protein n=1 Tax=unclassified Synechococcus TaxID=2626047 RepID=UPI0039C31636
MLEMIFNGANWFALPFWAMMILLPGWKVTRKVMESLLPIAILAAVYLYLLVTGFNADVLKEFSNPQLSLTSLTDLFSQPAVMATGWVHYIVMDLFVGRWIFLEGWDKRVWTTHSLILCLFAGPVGLLSHLLTVAVVQARRQNQAQGRTQETGVPQELANP